MTHKRAIELLNRYKPTNDPRLCCIDLCDAVDVAIEALEKQSELVHCSECKDWKKYGKDDNIGVCQVAGYFVGENGYCCYGKREEK